MHIPQSIGRHNDEHATIRLACMVTINGGMQSTSWSQVPVDLWPSTSQTLTFQAAP